MKSKNKFIILLLFLAGAFVVYHFLGQNWAILGVSRTDFGKTLNNAELEKIISTNLSGKKGEFAVVVEELEATSSVKHTPDESKPTSGEVLQQQTSSEVSPGSSEERLPSRRYVLNEKEFFPSASLYKLVLLAAVMKEVEADRLKLEDMIPGSKSDLVEKMGDLDFGYEESPENFEFSVEEILERIGRISDNFAAIMLTEKLRQLSGLGSQLSESGQSVVSQSVTEKQKTEKLNSENRNLKTDNQTDPLLKMAKQLGMNDTSFTGIPNTTASDIALFFKKLYQGEVVSKSASAKIIEILSLSQINDRIPALLPDDVRVVHKTGELPMLRHDAGLVYLNSDKSLESRVKKNYLIVLLSKDLEFEDDGVETLAQISKGVYDYFSQKQ